MTKYTKKQYLADVAANDKEIEINVWIVSGFLNRIEKGEKITDKVYSQWKSAHDRFYKIHNDRAVIECRFRRRNLALRDNNLAALVSQNID